MLYLNAAFSYSCIILPISGINEFVLSLNRRAELPHFLEAIKSDVADIRYTLPDEMVRETVETSRG